MATTTITIRVDEKLKKSATEAFEEMGLSLANGISVYLTRVAATKEIPFRVAVPQVAAEPPGVEYFGLTGDAYRKHLLEAKKRVLEGRCEAHELLED